MPELAVVLIVAAVVVIVGSVVVVGRVIGRTRRLLHAPVSMLGQLGAGPLLSYDAGMDLARWQLLDQSGLDHVAREHILARARVALWDQQLAEHGAAKVPSPLVEAMRGYADGLAAYLPDEVTGGRR